jgi:hypothetical protein
VVLIYFSLSEQRERQVPLTVKYVKVLQARQKVAFLQYKQFFGQARQGVD